MDFTTLRARQIPGLIAGGRTSAAAIAEFFLDRIAATEPVVAAWTHVDRDKAMAAAAAVDKAAAKGPLAGVPVGVKDVIDTADLPTAYGSAAYAGVQPAWDAPCVALTRAAGGVVLGKTVSTEFAMASPGKTRNPWNPGHTPGGSSSGSCAAVAAGTALMAFGTQTAGSIIRPAAYCGVVGYKPSFGTLDRTAIKVLSGGLDTLGMVTRDVRDAAFCTAVLADRPDLAVPPTISRPKVGLFRTTRWSQAEAPARDAAERAGAALADAGFAVREVATPAWFDEFFDLQEAVMGWEVTRALAYERLVLTGRITPVTRDFLGVKAQVTWPQYAAALARLPALRADLDDLFGEDELLLTLAAPGEAPAGLAATGSPLFNQAWSIAHNPCLTLPFGFGPQGLPLGVQLVGRLGGDGALLAGAAAIEDALGAGKPAPVGAA